LRYICELVFVKENIKFGIKEIVNI